MPMCMYIGRFDYIKLPSGRLHMPSRLDLEYASPASVDTNTAVQFRPPGPSNFIQGVISIPTFQQVVACGCYCTTLNFCDVLKVPPQIELTLTYKGITQMWLLRPDETPEAAMFQFTRPEEGYLRHKETGRNCT